MKTRSGALCVYFLALLCLAPALLAAELGRKTIQPGSEVRNYSDARIAELPGLDVGWDITLLSWDVGARSFSDQAGSPSLALFYGVNESLDLRATLKYAEGEDVDEGVVSHLSTLRLGFGARLWGKRGLLYPYAGGLVNYYFLNDDELGSVDGALGLSVEAGLAYLIQDVFMVRGGIEGEVSLLDGQATVGGREEDVSIAGFSVGVGVILLF
jgi:hypothetical protein